MRGPSGCVDNYLKDQFNAPAANNPTNDGKTQQEPWSAHKEEDK